MKFNVVVILAAVALAGAVASPAFATTLDLTTAGASGTLNGAIYQQVDPQSTGTGVIDSFVRLSDNTGTVSGYNTTVDGTFNNTSDDTHNHALLLTDVPIVNIDGVDYRQFLLDVNENLPNSLISLDEVQVFQSSVANQSVTTFTGGIVDLANANLVYQMDPGNSVLLDYALNSGSGSGDMFLYIPDSFFSFGGEFVYLYSKFGMDLPNAQEDAGFEEWAVLSGESTPIPEPASMLLMGIGLAGLAARRRFQA